MRKALLISLVAIFLIGILGITQTDAETSTKDEMKIAAAVNIRDDNSWEGVWEDNRGAQMTIREANGFLDVFGKDSVSVYTAVCLIDSNAEKKAKCQGEGMNIGNFRFLYENTMSINEEGQLSETWKASLVNQTIDGETIFEKQN